MGEPRATRRLIFRALFAGLSALVIFVQLLPLDLAADHPPAPDLLILLCFAWALRRPDYVPTLLVAAVLLASDILFMGPLGLGAALGVVGVEALRRRGEASADLPFAAEWLLVTAVLAAVTLAEMVILAVLLVPQPPFGARVLQLVISAATYPIVALATGCGFGVRPVTAAEREALGGRR